MLPGRQYSPEEITRVLLKGKWLILIPLILGIAAAIPISKRIPERFRSETLIMVVPQQIPDSYVTPVISSTIAERLPSIHEQILSRSRLELIIRDLDPYKKERERAVIMEDIVQRMRSDIGVKLEGKESFRVSYVNLDPKIAQSVTQRLASLFIEENLRDRERVAEGTNRFLESQLEDAKRRLLDQEKKLEEYRRRYTGQLPTQLQANLQSIQNAQMQLQSVEESMNRARERRLLIEGQIADVQSRPIVFAQPGTASSTEPALLTTAQQLDAAKIRLAQFQQRYTTEHPDIRALQRAIEQLEAKLQEELRKPADAGPTKALSAADVARDSRLRDLQSQLQVIDHQLSSSQAEKTRLKQVIADTQTNVDAVPTRESELVELTRDYGALQKSYSDLLTKREQSKLATDLERRQVGEQFKILDPASHPERPYNQLQRLALSFSGAIAGVMLGLVAIAIGEYRDSSLKTEEDVRRLLQLPVLALVPQMTSDRERRGQRRRRGLLGIATIVVLLGSAAAVLLWRAQL
jgi:polysaccharide chain length determinant protein (PEP-CTERM system associated)